jgi:competence protein ComGC
MKSKSLTILISVLVILITASAVFLFFNKPNLTVQDKQIIDNTKPFVIKIIYPYIPGLDEFNKKVQDAVNKELNDFKTNSLANDAAVKQVDPVDYAKYPREYDLNIGYDKGEIDNNIVSVILNVYNFEGGAHGASYFIPINYNPKLKTEIKLADLFPNQKDYLKKNSEFCIKDLTKQIITKLGSTDGTWIQGGAGPTEENYSFFLINKNNIVFYFPQYQVAYGAAGDFKVTMPR